MIGLIDCNNFFVSCERVFNPALINKPVVILSNNDGCAVSISNEAKALGIKRGAPYFQIKDIAEKNHVYILSGNIKLYGDMSSRVMATLSSIIPNIEIYSIDEAFIDFSGINTESLNLVGAKIVSKIFRDTGIPTSLGIASTKTLAKIASKFAKKFRGYNGVCCINTESQRITALKLSMISDVWGIGRNLAQKMLSKGINTAADFAQLPLERVRNIVNVTGERTWRELNGESCINIETIEPEKKQICTSRSFASPIYEFDLLVNAISSFASTASRKLREQSWRAVSLTVFIHTDSYNNDIAQYCNSAHITLEEPTNDTLTITSKAVETLKKIYRSNYCYKKAGIIITEIVDQNSVQQVLFIPPEDRSKRNRLMKAMESINQNDSTYNMVHTASCDPEMRLSRKGFNSQQYTTRLSDIITIRCK